MLPLNSEITFFPVIRALNITDGWNVEGTPHNRAIWQHNIAIPAQCGDYVVRNLLQWNTRSLFINKDYMQLKEGLIKAGFQVIKEDREKAVLFNPSPSSYFMRLERNALAIGKASPGLVMNYPWMVQGRSAFLEDYLPEELAHFKLVYLTEPQVRDFRRFEEIVAGLAKSGKTVIIEPGREETWPFFGTNPYWEKILSGSKLVPVKGSPYPHKEIPLEPDPSGQAPAMGNMDGIWMELVTGDKRVPVIGYKSVGGGRVYFVGLALGQQLQTGPGREIRALLEQLMDLARPHKGIVPAPFPVSNASWRHDGFSFEYSLEKPEPAWISVTYTPRWKALVDGEKLPVYSLENLILVNLPPGRHAVTFKYGMTWVGWAGIALSAVSLIFAAVICLKFRSMEEWLGRFSMGKVIEKIAE